MHSGYSKSMGVLNDPLILVNSEINQIKANAKTHLSYQKYEFNINSWVQNGLKYELTITSVTPFSLEVYIWDDTKEVYKALDDDQYAITIKNNTTTLISTSKFVGMIVLGYTYQEPTFIVTTNVNARTASITGIGNPSSNSYVVIPPIITNKETDYKVTSVNLLSANTTIATLDMSATEIRDVSIGRWTNLKTILFSPETKIIGTFQVSSLTSLDLPDGVTTLMPSWGIWLSSIGTTINLPTKLISIGGSTFPENITTFKFQDGKSTNGTYSIVDGSSGEISNSGQIIIKNLGDEKYELTCALSKITKIPDIVTSIGVRFVGDGFTTLDLGNIQDYGTSLGVGNHNTAAITFNSNGKYSDGILVEEQSFVNVNTLLTHDGPNIDASSLTVSYDDDEKITAIYCERKSREVRLIFVDSQGKTKYPYNIPQLKDDKGYCPYFGWLNTRPVQYHAETTAPVNHGVWLWKNGDGVYEIRLITSEVDTAILTCDSTSGCTIKLMATATEPATDTKPATHAILKITGSCMAFAIRDRGDKTDALKVKAGTQILSRGAVGIKNDFSGTTNYRFSAYPTIDFSGSGIKYIESLDVNNQKAIGVPVLAKATAIDIPSTVIYARGGLCGPGVNAITTSNAANLYYGNGGTLYARDGNGQTTMLVCEPHFKYVTPGTTLSSVEYRTACTIPSWVTELGVYSLTNPNLATLDLSHAVGLKVIGQYTIDLPACTTLLLPDGLEAVMSVGIRCPRLTELQLPSTIKYLQVNCFVTDTLQILDMSLMTEPIDNDEDIDEVAVMENDDEGTNADMIYNSFFSHHVNLKIKGYPKDPKDPTKPSLAKAVAEKLGGPDRFIDASIVTATPDSSDIEQ